MTPDDKLNLQPAGSSKPTETPRMSSVQHLEEMMSMTRGQFSRIFLPKMISVPHNPEDLKIEVIRSDILRFISTLDHKWMTDETSTTTENIRAYIALFIDYIKQKAKPENYAELNEFLLRQFIRKTEKYKDFGTDHVNETQRDIIIIPLIIDHIAREGRDTMPEEFASVLAAGLTRQDKPDQKAAFSIQDKDIAYETIMKRYGFFKTPANVTESFIQFLSARETPKEVKDACFGLVKEEITGDHAALIELMSSSLSMDAKLRLLALYRKYISSGIYLGEEVTTELLVAIAVEFKSAQNKPWYNDLVLTLVEGIDSQEFLQKLIELFEKKYPVASNIIGRLKNQRSRVVGKMDVVRPELLEISQEQFELRRNILEELTKWLESKKGLEVWERYQFLLHPDDRHTYQPLTLSINDAMKVEILKVLTNEKVFPAECADDMAKELAIYSYLDNITELLFKAVPVPRLLTIYAHALVDCEIELKRLTREKEEAEAILAYFHKQDDLREDMTEHFGETLQLNQDVLLESLSNGTQEESGRTRDDYARALENLPTLTKECERFAYESEKLKQALTQLLALEHVIKKNKELIKILFDEITMRITIFEAERQGIGHRSIHIDYESQTLLAGAKLDTDQ
jgi:hypothetical protein